MERSATGDPRGLDARCVTYDVHGFYQLNRAIRLAAGMQKFGDRLYQEHLDSRTDLSYGLTRCVPYRPREYVVACRARWRIVLASPT
jgi:hypothetical protein